MLAVELVDPVSMTLVSKQVSLTASGLEGPARISFSGRFAWLREGNNWPSAFEFKPGLLPFDAQTIPALAKPADLNSASEAERLLRVELRPTAAYPFADGVTVVRGSLRESAMANALPVAGAQIWLSWFSGKKQIDGSNWALSNTAGDFACFLRLPVPARPNLDKNRQLVLSLVVKRGNERRELALTVPDGRISDLPNALAWSALTPT